MRRILAGEEGLEPSHAGIKIRCLNQLGDSPTLTLSFTGCVGHPDDAKPMPRKQRVDGYPDSLLLRLSNLTAAWLAPLLLRRDLGTRQKR
jgi:hypothetical protein